VFPGQFAGLRNWEVGELLTLSRRRLIELREEWRAINRDGCIWVPRANLENFLRRRWVFASALPAPRAHHELISRNK
jgi:hypothetical protein